MRGPDPDYGRLSLLVGGSSWLASLLRLGFVADFISEPVLVGFKAGIGSSSCSISFPSCWASISQGRVLPQPAGDRSGDPARPRCRRWRSESGTICCWSRSSTGSRSVPGTSGRDGRGDRRREPARTGGPGVETIGKVAEGLPSFISPDLSLDRRALAGRPGHRTDELHRDDRGRASVRTDSDEPPLGPTGSWWRPGSPTPAARSGKHARGRRNVADGGEPHGGGPHTARGARHRGATLADHAALRGPIGLCRRRPSRRWSSSIRSG